MNNFTWNDLLLSSVGGLIGGALTLVGVYCTHWLQSKQNAEKEAEHLLGLLQGIHDEIETLWEVYSSSIGAHVETLQDNSPLMVFWPINQDYFTIYNTNAFFIGKIKSHDIRKSIVATYTQARALIDSYRMNNDMFQKYEYASILAEESQLPVHQKNVQILNQQMVQYASQVKKRHIEFRVMVTELLRSLRKEGVLSINGSAKP